MAACEGQSYQVFSSSSQYPVPSTFYLSHYFCGVVRKVQDACEDERMVTLELVYPSICHQIRTVQKYNACQEIYRPGQISEWSSEERKEFSETIFRYTRENIALVNIFIKDPFAVKILIQAKASRYIMSNMMNPSIEVSPPPHPSSPPPWNWSPLKLFFH